VHAIPEHTVLRLMYRSLDHYRVFIGHVPVKSPCRRGPPAATARVTSARVSIVRIVRSLRYYGAAVFARARDYTRRRRTGSRSIYCEINRRQFVLVSRRRQATTARRIRCLVPPESNLSIHPSSQSSIHSTPTRFASPTSPPVTSTCSILTRSPLPCRSLNNDLVVVVVVANRASASASATDRQTSR